MYAHLKGGRCQQQQQQQQGVGGQVDAVMIGRMQGGFTRHWNSGPLFDMYGTLAQRGSGIRAQFLKVDLWGCMGPTGHDGTQDSGLRTGTCSNPLTKLSKAVKTGPRVGVFFSSHDDGLAWVVTGWYTPSGTACLKMAYPHSRPPI